MAELLVKAVDFVSSGTADEDRAGAYKKGDIVIAMDDGHSWGAREGPPKFVIVRAPDLPLATAVSRIQSWRMALTWNVLQRDVPNDAWRVRMENSEQNPALSAFPKQALIQFFLDKWNCTFVRMDPEGPVLDWSIDAGVDSEGFWGRDPTTVGAIIATTAYDQGTGIHSYSVTFTGGITKLIAFRAATQNGTNVIDDGTTLTFDLDRQVVLDRFRDEILSKSGSYKRRRYSLPQTIAEDSVLSVDAILAADPVGGVIDTTAAALAASVVDHRD